MRPFLMSARRWPLRRRPYLFGGRYDVKRRKRQFGNSLPGWDKGPSRATWVRQVQGAAEVPVQVLTSWRSIRTVAVLGGVSMLMASQACAAQPVRLGYTIYA